MRINIVTLNYNSSKETLELLKSLKEQIDTNFEIIVVDNASEEVIHIPTSQVGYPQVKLFRNSENLGFSGGNNVGIRHALKNGSDWVVLLNNDTWAERDLVERLRAILSVKKGIIGIPLIEDDRAAYCGKIQWLKPTLFHISTCDVGNPPRTFSANIATGGKAAIAEKVRGPQVYAIGGAVAIHKDVFEKIGLLDEKYFLYFEDADFSVRARKAGFNISIAENLNVHHHVSSSTKKLGSPLLLRYHYRNALYFNLKNGPWYIKLFIWPWSWIILFKQLIKITTNKNKKESMAILKGVIGFYLRRFGKINESRTK